MSQQSVNRYRSDGMNVCRPIFVLFVDDSRHFQVDFGSSLDKAVLQLHMSVNEESIGSPVCLSFSVDYISPTVRLLVTVANNTDDRDVNWNSSDSRHIRVITSSGLYNILVPSGCQHVIFTAKKVRVTRTADRLVVLFRPNAGPCSYHTSGK